MGSAAELMGSDPSPHLPGGGAIICALVVTNWHFVAPGELKPKFHLARHVTSRHDSTRSTRLARHVERVESRCDEPSGIWA